ncbi:Beta-glucosidase [Dactylellina cionopaga]|nr:Beta-glucosidase [Dactylellina cionopaga]
MDGTTAALTPSAVSLAATFDTSIIEGIGHLLAAEVNDKKADVLLAPTAIQSHGIATTVKHFVANDQETRRFILNQHIPERALREMHLIPFQIAIRDASPWTLMTSYSKINGTYVSNNKTLLQGILRDEWDYDGLVMSDWFGTNSIVPSLEAGMDLEMPCPSRKRGQKLLDAVKLGHLKEGTIEKSAKRVYKTGKYNPLWPKDSEEAINRPEHQRFLREAAADGIVLLKNTHNLLPLTLEPGLRIGFIGPNSRVSVAVGGGSANLNPHYRQTPYDSFIENADIRVPGVIVSHATGCLSNKWTPLVPESCVSPVNGQHGVLMELFGNTTINGPAIAVSHRKRSMLTCYDNLPKSFTFNSGYSYRATGLITPHTTGRHTFSLSSCGPSRMLVDDIQIISLWDWRKDSERSELLTAYASPEQRFDLFMEAGRRYTLIVEGISREMDSIHGEYFAELYREEIMDGARVGFMEEVQRDLIGEAIDLARESDVVVVVVGKNAEWESKAYDMETMDLPGDQNKLISELLKVNPKTVIVNQSGSPITMPWIERASTVIQAWYQGQELGNAMFDVLTGHVNPNGKLPVTFPKRLEDTPTYHNFPGENDQVFYGEGIWLGYRHYDKADIEPLFPFGFGLSYTNFEYSNVRASSLIFHTEIIVSVDVTNTGYRFGKESVQFYVSQISKPGLPRPVRELKGFAKVVLQPGETKTASYKLDKYSLGYFNEKLKKWIVDENAEFEVFAAASSRDLRGSAIFSIMTGMNWIK